MHEWALAQAVISTVDKVIKEEEFKKDVDVNVKLGSLQQIDQEIFDFALEEIISSGGLDIVNLNIEVEEAVLKCNICEKKWLYKDSLKALNEDETEFIHFLPETSHAYIECPKCGSSDFEVIKGRGVWIESIKGE